MVWRHTGVLQNFRNLILWKNKTRSALTNTYGTDGKIKWLNKVKWTLTEQQLYCWRVFLSNDCFFLQKMNCWNAHTKYSIYKSGPVTQLFGCLLIGLHTVNDKMWCMRCCCFAPVLVMAPLLCVCGPLLHCLSIQSLKKDCWITYCFKKTSTLLYIEGETANSEHIFVSIN